jgi:chromate transporter
MILTLFTLFISFVKVGLFGWGGGAALIPLIERECLRHQWLNPGEFSDLIALSAASPGVFAVKMAAYIGYRQAGVLGSVTGVAGIVLPGVLVLFALFYVAERYQKNVTVQKVILGLKYGAAGFIAYSIFKVLPAAPPTRWTLIIGLLLSAAVFVALRYGCDPILAIIIAGMLGVVLF